MIGSGQYRKRRLLLLCDRRWTGDKEKYYHRNQLRGYVEITDGIKEGEEVIADLGDYTEGMEVQAVPEQTGEDADE